ncbi:hypothetical protein MPER_01151, partial [Moniliophthora perniciosa FA553]
GTRAGLNAGGSRSGGKTPIGGHRAGSTQPQNDAAVLHLQNQVKEMSGALEGLEKERDFYFEKNTCPRGNMETPSKAKSEKKSPMVEGQGPSTIFSFSEPEGLTKTRALQNGPR